MLPEPRALPSRPPVTNSTKHFKKSNNTCLLISAAIELGKLYPTEHCMNRTKIIMPNTGQTNNIAQPKFKDRLFRFSSHFIYIYIIFFFYRLTVD